MLCWRFEALYKIGNHLPFTFLLSIPLDWQKPMQSFDDLTTCGDLARLASRLNWISTPPLSSLQPYTLARAGRVQLEYVNSWTSSTSAIYGRFWALRGRTTWRMEVLSRTGQRRLQDIVAERRLRMTGHIIRMPPGRPANHTMSWTPRGSGRWRGRPTKTWRSKNFKEDLVDRGVDWNNVRAVATNRSRWRTLAAHCLVKDRRIYSKC